jgi:methionyl-tRNA synthetase
MSAGLPLPRLVWVHGWLLVQGDKMSKSRGNFFDPIEVVRALTSDGARYVSLREAAFDRDSDVSWESFVRRYNADLANDIGNHVNRTVKMVNRNHEGERPRPAGGPLAADWAERPAACDRAIEGFLLHEALAGLWEFVGAANRFVDAEKPWELAGAARGGDAVARDRLRGVLGDLVEACRLLALAAAPCLPSTAPRILAQLGYAYPYGADGNGGPPLLDELAWGAHAGDAGRVASPEPLFPRLEVESATA